MNDICKKLKEIGVTVDQVVNRLGGNEPLYLKICIQFLQDKSFQQCIQAVTRKDYPNAEIWIHTLKGVSANLGFTNMEHLCSDILNKLKAKNYLLLELDITNLSKEYRTITSILSK